MVKIAQELEEDKLPLIIVLLQASSSWCQTMKNNTLVSIFLHFRHLNTLLWHAEMRHLDLNALPNYSSQQP